MKAGMGRVSRRSVLRGAGATAGLAVGSGAIRGFPTIWAQNIKDVVLNHTGPPVTAIPRIAEQATKDLGFTVHMQTVENADLLNRFLSQSSSFDCADVSIVFLRYLVGRNILQTIPRRQGQGLGQDDPAVHQGPLPRRTRGLEAGCGALHGGLRRRSGRPEVRGRAHRLADRRADRDQRRHARHPSRSGRPADHELGRPGQPRVQGQGRAAGPADRRRHRRRDGDGGERARQVRQQGQHDPRRDRQDHRHDDGDQALGPVPFVLDHVRPVGEPDGLGRGGDPVDVVAGGDRGAHARRSVRVPAAEGRLSRLGLHASAS